MTWFQAWSILFCLETNIETDVIISDINTNHIILFSKTPVNGGACNIVLTHSEDWRMQESVKFYRDLLNWMQAGDLSHLPCEVHCSWALNDELWPSKKSYEGDFDRGS